MSPADLPRLVLPSPWSCSCCSTAAATRCTRRASLRLRRRANSSFRSRSSPALYADGERCVWRKRNSDFENRLLTGHLRLGSAAHSDTRTRIDTPPVPVHDPAAAPLTLRPHTHEHACGRPQTPTYTVGVCGWKQTYEHFHASSTSRIAARTPAGLPAHPPGSFGSPSANPSARKPRHCPTVNR